MGITPDRPQPAPNYFLEPSYFIVSANPLRSTFAISPVLPARELQNRTLPVGENNRADTADDRKPRAGGAIDASTSDARRMWLTRPCSTVFEPPNTRP
jgi:hypothetical protein